MRVAWAAWVQGLQGLQGLAKAALFITLAAVINRFEQERKARVIALIHRQETVSVFGGSDLPRSLSGLMP